MLKRILIPLWLFLPIAAGLVAGCSSLNPPATTAPVLVITATVESVPTSLPAETPTEATESVTPEPAPSKTTTVKSITAKTAVNIRRTPSLQGEVLGQLFPGQKADVSAMSEDGNWWQIVCPATLSGDCWVSADPQLTEAALP